MNGIGETRAEADNTNAGLDNHYPGRTYRTLYKLRQQGRPVAASKDVVAEGCARS